MKVEIETTRFGKIEVPDEEILSFPKGLIGFEKLKQYILLDSSKGNAIQWLQSLDDPDIAFLVSEPKKTFPFIEINYPEPSVFPSSLSAPDFEQLKLLTILHVDHEKKLLHIHIQAPLLINPLSRQGAQVITETTKPTVSLPLNGS